MKPTELIIGSLIEYNGAVCKVIGISNDIIKVDNYFYDEDMDVRCDKIQGIPLTTEILDKNFGKGIELNGNSFDDTRWTIDADLLWLFMDDEGDYFIKERKGSPHYIKHVHQLQQWLNILGIEKEIKL